MTNTLTRLLLTAAFCGLFLSLEAQERGVASAFDSTRMTASVPTDSVSRDYRLDSVVIGTQRSPSPLGSIAEGRFRLLMRNSNALPRFAGSIDPMRILQLMPGVQTVSEGNSGLYVRGNDAGQNLILLNQAPLYAHAHLLGFFSIFNPGQVASFELSKTGGGRIETAMQPATVIVQSREETGVRWGVEGDLGIIASQATVTAPLGRRAALFLSGRRSYTGWLIGALSPKGDDDLHYRLQDYDATLAWQLDGRNKLTINSHYGDDHTRIAYNAGLLGGRLRWYAGVWSATLHSELSPTAHMENALYYSRLDTRLTASTTGIAAEAPSSIGDLGYKHSTRWRIGRLQLAAGLQYAYRRIHPQHIASDYGGVAAAERGPRYDTHELAPFVAATIPLAHNLTCDAALRYGFYFLQGDGSIASYRHGTPQPNLTFDWSVARGSRLRASYNYTTQYIHKVPSSNISFATDFWMAPTRRTPPQRTHHAAVGYFAEAADGRLNFSAEAYYQRMYRVLEYNAPLTGLVNNRYDLEQYIHSGDGEAYGVEFMASYAGRKFNGWISYTLGKSVRQFAALNNGRSFPASLDRRHDLSLSLCCTPGRRWELSTVFVYASGGAYTSTRDLYIAGGSFVRGHGSYNGARLPDYHRLDLSVTYWLQREPWRSGINLSVFNLYAHRNPLYISWPVLVDEEKSEYQIHPRKHYLYNIIPSVSWIFKF